MSDKEKIVVTLQMIKRGLDLLQKEIGTDLQMVCVVVEAGRPNACVGVLSNFDRPEAVVAMLHGIHITSGVQHIVPRDAAKPEDRN